ncbi:MAG: hypothetical protein ACTTJR_07615 [Filifactor alocis]
MDDFFQSVVIHELTHALDGEVIKDNQKIISRFNTCYEDEPYGQWNNVGGGKGVSLCILAWFLGHNRSEGLAILSECLLCSSERKRVFVPDVRAAFKKDFKTLLNCGWHPSIEMRLTKECGITCIEEAIYTPLTCSLMSLSA